jgi:5'-nucleotidase
MKTLLITGDDGYQAVGLQLLANIFKNNFEVTVIATKVQKSGAGGGLKASGEKAWGYEKIDDCDYYWVDGTPADTMELAQGKFPQGFDYLISGINWGENFGLCTVTASGTGGAALRALTLGIAKRVIMMNWMQNTKEKTVHDPYDENIKSVKVEDYYDYPGKSARYIFDEIINNNFWDKRIVNVNFPPSKTNEYKLTKLVDVLTKVYKYPVIIEEGIYRYDEQVFDYTEDTKNDLSIDIGATVSGYISVTPFDIG